MDFDGLLHGFLVNIYVAIYMLRFYVLPSLEREKIALNNSYSANWTTTIKSIRLLIARAINISFDPHSSAKISALNAGAITSSLTWDAMLGSMLKVVQQPLKLKLSKTILCNQVSLKR